MSFYVVYNPNINNALLAICEEKPDAIPEGMVLKGYPSALPDMTRVFWNTATLMFDAKPHKILSKKEFMKRLTVAEYAAIKAATTQHPVVDFYWQMFMSISEVNLENEDTVAGLNMLEMAGILASGRAAEILA